MLSLVCCKEWGYFILKCFLFLCILRVCGSASNPSTAKLHTHHFKSDTIWSSLLQAQAEDTRVRKQLSVYSKRISGTVWCSSTCTVDIGMNIPAKTQLSPLHQPSIWHKTLPSPRTTSSWNHLLRLGSCKLGWIHCMRIKYPTKVHESLVFLSLWK